MTQLDNVRIYGDRQVEVMRAWEWIKGFVAGAGLAAAILFVLYKMPVVL